MDAEAPRFQDVMDYMFTGRVLVDGEEDLEELAADADTLRMPNLMDAVRAKLKLARAKASEAAVEANRAAVEAEETQQLVDEVSWS